MRWLLAFSAFVFAYLLGVFMEKNDFPWWIGALIGVGAWIVYERLLDNRERLRDR